VPHKEKRFAGYDADSKSFSPEILRKYIFGGHVAEYMGQLESDPEAYKRQFSSFQKAGIKGDGLEALYTKVHAAIRKDPSMVKTKKKVAEGEKPKSYGQKPLSYAQRKDKIRQKKASAAKKNAQ